MASSGIITNRQHRPEELGILSKDVVGRKLVLSGGLTRAAMRDPAAIVEVWKGLLKGVRLDLNNSTVLTALAWLQDPPSRIPDPSCSIQSRSSEAYFVLWAYTRRGYHSISQCHNKFKGLRYNRTLFNFEIQRFAREVFTQGTQLAQSWAQRSWVGYEDVEMLALTFLMARPRTLTMKGMKRIVKRVFGEQNCSRLGMLLSKMSLEESSSFVACAIISKGRTVYSFAYGHENLIFKDRVYGLGPVGYFDIPGVATRNTLTSLPHEIKVIIFRHLFKFDEDVHVRLQSTAQVSAPPFDYKFGLTSGPRSIPPGTWIDPVQNFFSLTETNWENRRLTLEIFYAENTFILGPFPPIQGQSDIFRYHLGQWRSAIGSQASSFLHDNVWRAD